MRQSFAKGTAAYAFSLRESPAFNSPSLRERVRLRGASDCPQHTAITQASQPTSLMTQRSTSTMLLCRCLAADRCGASLSEMTSDRRHSRAGRSRHFWAAGTSVNKRGEQLWSWEDRLRSLRAQAAASGGLLPLNLHRWAPTSW